MTVFMTPDGEPFYGGTYFPKAAVPAADAAIDDVVPQQTATTSARTSTRSSRRSTAPPHRSPPTTSRASTTSNKAMRGLGRAFDAEWGGFGKAPKFPSTMNLDLLLRALHADGGRRRRRRSSRPRSTRWRPAGMYDHIGGGFARYSVDRGGWCPTSRRCCTTRHCCAGSICTGRSSSVRPQWRQVVDETITYVLATCAIRTEASSPPRMPTRRTRTATGTRVCSTRGRLARCAAALSSTVADEVDEALAWYGITDDGKSPSTAVPAPFPPRMHQHGGSSRDPPTSRRHGSRLFTARPQRRRPGLDDKVLTEWNALFLSALAEAAALFGPARTGSTRPSPTPSSCSANSRDRTAVGTAGGMPTATRRRAIPRSPPIMPRWSTRSRGSARRPGRRAGSTRPSARPTRCSTTSGTPSSGGLFTTADDGEALVVRQKDLFDNATPSANSMAAMALVPARRAHRRAALRPPRRPDPAAAGHGWSPRRPAASRTRSAAADLRRRGVTEVVDRRRPPRSGAPRPFRVASRHRARLGRALRLTALGRAPGGLRVRLSRLHLPGAAGLLDGFGEALLGRPVKVVTVPGPTKSADSGLPATPVDDLARLTASPVGAATGTVGGRFGDRLSTGATDGRPRSHPTSSRPGGMRTPDAVGFTLEYPEEQGPEPTFSAASSERHHGHRAIDRPVRHRPGRRAGPETGPRLVGLGITVGVGLRSANGRAMTGTSRSRFDGRVPRTAGGGVPARRASSPSSTTRCQPCASPVRGDVKI